MNAKRIGSVAILSSVILTHVYSQNNIIKDINRANLFDAAPLSISPTDIDKFVSLKDLSEDELNKKDFSGFEISAILEPKIIGAKIGMFYANFNWQAGFAAEVNQKHTIMPGVGSDIIKVGADVDYFPLSSRAFRAYLGSGIYFRNESRFVGVENLVHKKQGIGLDAKVGVEFKPLKERKVRPFLELRQTFSLYEKKSKNYPLYDDISISKLNAAIGIKF